MAMGCAVTRTQRGVTITGNRSTSARIISNDKLPEPMMMDAWNSITGTPCARNRSFTPFCVAWSRASIHAHCQNAV